MSAPHDEGREPDAHVFAPLRADLSTDIEHAIADTVRLDHAAASFVSFEQPDVQPLPAQFARGSQA